MDTGRRKDVVIEDVYLTDDTGIRTRSRIIKIYADPSLLKIIGSVEGVLDAFTPLSPFEYDVFLDPRYNWDVVKENIEEAILCRVQ